MVDHPLAPLEGADPLPLAARSRRDLRRPRERPHGPPGYGRGLRRDRVRRGHHRGDGRHWHRPRRDRRVVGRRPLGRPARRRAPRARGRRRVHRAGRAVRHAPGARADAVRRAAGIVRGLGEVQPLLLARALPRLPRVLLLADLHRAALDEADRGLRQLGPRDDGRDAGAHVPGPRAQRPRRVRPPVQQDLVPGARDPRHRRRGADGVDGRADGEGDRRGVRGARGLRAPPARARSGARQPPAARLRRAAAGAADLDARPLAAQARALRLVADRARPRAARHRDRPRAAQPPPRPRDRLARPAPGDRGARRRRRARPPRQPRALQRVGPHRVRVGRARPALLPGVAAHGRDPRRQLHGLPRPRQRDRLRPLDRRRGLGDRLLPAREPGPEAGRLRVAHRLRRLAADARRRRARGHAHRRLQRRDDRAHRALPADPRPRDLRRQPGGHRPRHVRARPAGDRRLDRGALRLRRLRHRLRPGRARRPRAAARGARLRAGRAGVRGDGGRVGRRPLAARAGHGRLPRGPPARARPADDRRRRPADRSGVAARARRAGGPGLRARPLPAPGRLRPRRRAGRADDVDGADRQPPAVPLLPAQAPLRAEHPRAAPARPLRRGPLHGLRDGDARRSIAAAIAEEIGREVDYLPVETGGAAVAAARIAELI